ncbi:FHA domain-containing protein [Agaribacterium haliotis]|uniref:FHA domain-containing protein n=1 Tax=Agaribacterium haliotis TaxID=2013869 RepID=UPI000BB5512E|nr:FHA domain-containing protein [Agaribacterium haliotis]
MLKIKDQSSSKAALWLAKNCYNIGSDAAADIYADAEANAATIVVNKNGVFVRALDEATVQVDGREVSAEQALIAGNQLRIGNTVFLLIDPSQAESDDTVQAGAPPRMYQLVQLDQAKQRFTLNRRFVVGRAVDCDLLISHPKMSRYHAEIIVKGERLFLRDLNSANGSIVNGEKTIKCELHVGDKLEFAGRAFRLEQQDIESLDLDKTCLRPALLSSAITATSVNEPVKPVLQNQPKHVPAAGPASEPRAISNTDAYGQQAPSENGAAVPGKKSSRLLLSFICTALVLLVIIGLWL